MNKTEAIYKFFNSFNMPAYPNLAPEDAVFPFIVYESSIGNDGDVPIYIAVNLYFHTYSESIPNAKIEEISKKISRGGTMLKYDEGAIWIQKGSPFSVSVNNADASIKQKQLNISLTFL